MAKQDLTVFTRDQQTGVMKELAGGELKDFTRASHQAGPPQFNVLVTGADESERRLTIWQLGKAWPAEREMMVECAADGAEALEKIESNQYDLVVLDWNLPHQEGPVVLRAIRRGSRRVPVVVLSGQRREAIARDLETWSAAFVNKDELDRYHFGSAIAAAIQLQEDGCWIGSDPETMQA